MDFADLWIILAGVKTKVFLFTFRLSFSGKAVHRAFATQSQEAFLEGHVAAFDVLGGVPVVQVRYDNLKAAVSRVLSGRNRLESDRWVSFRSHYGFDAFYCRPGREGAHEKGGVEGEGGRFDTVASAIIASGQAGLMRRRPARVPAPRSAFIGFRFPPEVIMVAVRWYLRYGLSYRDVEELLAERGIEVDNVTIYRWVQRFTPLLIDAARPCRHVPGDCWFVDETYVKVAGRWVYLYRAIDQYGQVIDVLVSEKRDLVATRRFFIRALRHGSCPAEVSTDRAPTYPRVLDEVLPTACHIVEQYANNPIEADHGRLKSRLRPMRGLKRFRSARVISAGHAFVQKLCRGHYELGLNVDPGHRLLEAFAELALTI